ncbi:hypothetical protein PHSY_002843 [Pseudozyma hubeiensis SY62]|uniref:Uncharacterized protein n=1 Tax=Pseudozyma hubeiensis (strain SY62) TaxID=1305764 RepID=R9P1T2_PSEHS|nr:hypothetical protein PHSY_002843 [Pseudozyma hubeiensis SY62]GAC95268.1 hypothetical protein PHSY_002843 [Pseudozyma hubeiensis SY62]
MRVGQGTVASNAKSSGFNLQAASDNPVSAQSHNRITLSESRQIVPLELVLCGGVDGSMQAVHIRSTPIARHRAPRIILLLTHPRDTTNIIIIKSEHTNHTNTTQPQATTATPHQVTPHARFRPTSCTTSAYLLITRHPSHTHRIPDPSLFPSILLNLSPS